MLFWGLLWLLLTSNIVAGDTDTSGDTSDNSGDQAGDNSGDQAGDTAAPAGDVADASATLDVGADDSSTTAADDSSVSSRILPLPFPPFPIPTSCICGHKCRTSWGASGICQLNGQCQVGSYNSPNCHPKKCICGTRCTTSFGISGWCGTDRTCHATWIRPNCNGGYGDYCTTDDDCPTGQQCTGIGIFKTCHASTGHSCSNVWPFNFCPLGQNCVNGHCVTGGCYGDNCLPCCPPVYQIFQQPCRDCGFIG